MVAQTWHRGRKGHNLWLSVFFAVVGLLLLASSCHGAAGAAVTVVHPIPHWGAVHALMVSVQVLCPGHVPWLLLRPEQQWGLLTLLSAVTILWCPTQQGFPCLAFYRTCPCPFWCGSFFCINSTLQVQVLHKGLLLFISLQG